MSTELIVAALWSAALVYWWWRRRPSFGDSVRSFRYELSVLGHTTPTRVPPANRLRNSRSPAQGRSRPAHLALPAPRQADVPATLQAAAKSYRRLEARRRRRDVLSVLAGAVVLSALVAVVTGSAAVLYFQLSTDVVLAAYVYMLVKATSSSAARGVRRAPVGARRQHWPSGYGDFGSYSELATARAT
ncbi:MAG: hypothetical protein ACP5VR_07185 [Acidimicrobiales bacterium]